MNRCRRLVLFTWTPLSHPSYPLRLAWVNAPDWPRWWIELGAPL